MQRIFLLVCFLACGAAIIFTLYKRAPNAASPPVERGLAYLASVYTPYHYPDPYLEYRYPGESLSCPLEGCSITYRILDAFFDVAFIEDFVPSARLLGKQLTDAAATLNALLSEWRSVNLSNTIQGGNAGGVALDTACILGYVTKDRTLADHVATFLTSDANWLRDDFYSEDRWRNIADETWCIRLLIVTGAAPDRINTLLEKKVEETQAFLETRPTPPERVAVIYHMVYLLADAKNPRYDALVDSYETMLHEDAEDQSLLGDTFTQANILDALCRGGSREYDALERIATRIRDRQQPNGSWVRSLDQAQYPVFTTFRAILALNAYEHIPSTTMYR